MKIGDLEHTAALSTESWAQGGSVNSKELGVEESNKTRQKSTTPADLFEFPSVESLSGESTTTTESNADFSPSLSSLSSSDDDRRLNDYDLSATATEMRFLANRSISGGHVKTSSLRNIRKNEVTLSAPLMSKLQHQNGIHNLYQDSVFSLRSMDATTRCTQSHTDDRTSESKQKGVHRTDNLNMADSITKTHFYKKNTGMFYYYLDESAFGGEIIQRMRKSLKTKKKRNQAYSKRNRNFEVSSDSSSENLSSKRNGPLKYATEMRQTGTTRMDNYGINASKNIFGSIKSNFCGGLKILRDGANNYNGGDAHLENPHVKNNAKLCHLRSPAENTNNNSKEEAYQEKGTVRIRGTIRCSSSVTLGEDVQKELRNRLVYLLKEQDRMLKEFDTEEKMGRRMVQRTVNKTVMTAQWKLDLKAVEMDYQKRVEGIISNLKATVQNERCSSSGPQGQVSRTGVNNNADNRPSEDGPNSPGFFRSLLKRRVNPLGEKEKSGARFSLKGLFTRRSRGIRDEGRMRLMHTEQSGEEGERAVSCSKAGAVSDREDVNLYLEKLKKIMKNMLKDVSETSDVDLLLEEAMILAGPSVGETDPVCMAQIEKLEMKFRCNFEKKMKKLRIEKEKGGERP